MLIACSDRECNFDSRARAVTELFNIPGMEGGLMVKLQDSFNGASGNCTETSRKFHRLHHPSPHDLYNKLPFIFKTFCCWCSWFYMFIFFIIFPLKSFHLLQPPPFPSAPWKFHFPLYTHHKTHSQTQSIHQSLIDKSTVVARGGRS